MAFVQYEKKCLICNENFLDGKHLSRHLIKIHKVTTEEYVIQHMLNGKSPQCEITNCNNIPRRVGFAFKRFCSDHAMNACAIGGKIGGQAAAWNKGKTKDTDKRLLAQSKIMSGQGNHFFGKTHTKESKEQMSVSKRIQSDEFIERIHSRGLFFVDVFKKSLADNEFILLTPIEEYTHRQCQYLKFQCVKCGHIDEKTLQAYERGSLCSRCYPATSSRGEIEVAHFVENLLKFDLVIRNDRKALAGLELDVFIPSKNFAIEYNGLYWHSEAAGKDEKHHKKKTDACINANIDLFQIYADDWTQNKAICQSMIAHRLGKSKQTVFARNCKIEITPSKISKEFFNKTHLNGAVNQKIAFSLVDKSNEIVACLSLRVPFNKNYRERKLIEIARFSTALNTSVPGGLGKLLAAAERWAQSNSYVGLMTYVDRSHGEGKGYLKAGMTFHSETTVSFSYTDGEIRYDRLKFCAQDGMTEAEYAASKGVYRIFESGNKVFVKMFPIAL